MSNYDRKHRCVGCNAHVMQEHEQGCVYDPNFEPVETVEDNERTINDIKRELEEGEGNSTL